MPPDQISTLEDLLANESFRQWVLSKDPEYSAFWEIWTDQAPGRTELVDQARTILIGMPYNFREKPLDPQMVRQEWKRLAGQLQGKPERPATFRMAKKERPKPAKLRIFKVAASIALLLGTAYLMREYVVDPKILHRTAFGQQALIHLPDSTSVSLNANSMLTYRKLNSRKVWLDGEAYFHVQKKPATGKNFLVITTDLTVEVLGTTFNVREKKTEQK